MAKMIFRDLLKELDFLLPNIIILEEDDRSDDLNYGQENNILGHTIEDYLTSRDYLELY